MNENEIMRQLKNCDTEISNEYNQFRAKITSVGDAAVKAMGNYKLLVTFVPILVGIVALLIFSDSFLGILCLIGGIFIGVKMSKSAKIYVQQVRNRRDTLDQANNRSSLDV